MAIPLHPNLKADLWSKHKSFLVGSTGVGDKLKLLEAAAKCDEKDAAGLAKLDQAVAGLMAVAVPAFTKAKASKVIPATTTKYLQDMIAKATELRKLVAEKLAALKAAAARPPQAKPGAPVTSASTSKSAVPPSAKPASRSTAIPPLPPRSKPAPFTATAGTPVPSATKPAPSSTGIPPIPPRSKAS